MTPNERIARAIEAEKLEHEKDLAGHRSIGSELAICEYSSGVIEGLRMSARIARETPLDLEPSDVERIYLPGIVLVREADGRYALSPHPLPPHWPPLPPRREGDEPDAPQQPGHDQHHRG
jgi:hypothetical protein